MLSLLVEPIYLLMKQLFSVITIVVLLTNCKSQKEIVTYTSDTLKIIPVSQNSFIHVSYLETNDFGKVACNGLVYINNNEAIVFDTPTNSEVSLELIKWIAEVKKSEITAVVINHFHGDCLGGLVAFHDLAIPSFASHKTISLAQSNHFTIPQIGFDDMMELSVGNEKIINRYFGEAHTRDNIVSYIPSEKIVFGGCMIKSLNATKGFTGDANTDEWSNTVQKIKDSYTDLKLIIPGHGKAGDTKLLDYTLALFQ